VNPLEVGIVVVLLAGVTMTTEVLKSVSVRVVVIVSVDRISFSFPEAKHRIDQPT